MVHFVRCKRHLYKDFNSSILEALLMIATGIGEEMSYIVPEKQETVVSRAQIIQKVR